MKLTESKKFALKFIAAILLILLALPVIFKLLGLLWDAIVYAFQLYVKYINMYFNDAEVSTAIACGILGFLLVVCVATFLAISDSY